MTLGKTSLDVALPYVQSGLGGYLNHGSPDI
jgi:hypothetical protein